MHLVAVGGSDAGISAALRARELDPVGEVTVVVADAYPNFSICGIPYYISGEVTHWRNLAHRTYADLEATGMRAAARHPRHRRSTSPAARLAVREPDGSESVIDYDELVVGTGAVPVRPPIDGLDDLGVDDGVHLLHSMGDTFALTASIDRIKPTTALIVGAGYVGLEMAEGLTTRGIAVTQVEMLPEVLPTVDPELGALVHAELDRHGVEVHTRTTGHPHQPGRRTAAAGFTSTAADQTRRPLGWDVDLVLVVVGVRPDTDLLVEAGAQVGARGAVAVDESMATGLPHVWAAGDCVVTHHRLLGVTYLPLGTTAHKQGRVAGENALGGNARFAGSLGTQVVKVFDLVAARTGLREHEAAGGRLLPAHQPGQPRRPQGLLPRRPAHHHPRHRRRRHRPAARRPAGRPPGTETAKRVDTYATALFHDMTVDGMSELDLSYTPPLGSPWDAVQMAAQAWVRDHQLPAQRSALRPAGVS